MLGAITERPLVRLTYLEMCNIVLDKSVFHKIAEDCPNLVELKLRRLHIPTPIFGMDHVSAMPVSLASLRSLTLSFHLRKFLDLVDGNYVYVLARIEAPSLEYLDIDVDKLLVSLTRVLPPPSSIPALRTLCIRNTVSSLYFDTEYLEVLSYESSVEEIRLVNARPEALGLHSPASKGQWAHLKTLSMDSNDTVHLVWLCKALMFRPEIRTVYLSRSALEELRENLVMVDMLDNLFCVGIRDSCGVFDGWEFAEGGYQICAEKWLRSRVVLNLF